MPLTMHWRAAGMGAALVTLAACGQSAESEPPAAATTAATTAAATAPADLGPPPPPEGDAMVTGTDYQATAKVDCGFEGAKPTASCDAGVKREWDGPGTALVEVMKPDGSKRALFFEGTRPIGADSAQADGSAAYSFQSSREGDRTTITFGPESYVIVDALIEGG